MSQKIMRRRALLSAVHLGHVKRIFAIDVNSHRRRRRRRAQARVANPVAWSENCSPHGIVNGKLCETLGLHNAE